MNIRVALTGNPNCGKTTLFNEYTGSNQYVGNWSGVTVEKKEGMVRRKDTDIQLIDLPGIYSLSPYSMEEIVTRDFIIDERPDVILDVVDGTNIERNLYLTVQLLELGIPVVVAVNMMDEVEAQGGAIDCGLLSGLLGAAVVPVSARKGENLDKLLDVCQASARQGNAPVSIGKWYDPHTREALDEIGMLIQAQAPDNAPLPFYSGKLLEGDRMAAERLGLDQKTFARIEEIARKYESASDYGDRETILADARYSIIAGICQQAVIHGREDNAGSVSDKIDRVLTHRIFALPVFLLILLIMFSITFGPVGEGLKGAMEWLIDEKLAVLVEGLLEIAQAPFWTYGLLIDAVIGGVGGILTFLPQILLLFLFLSVLEDSGYMARAAFIMDRLLHKLGLTGKSFIPMLMGFGCTTPAVMAAKGMDNEKDRRLTIMLTPFMSCGAKLPIYGLFASAFFASYKGAAVFSMYLIGMVVAVISGLLLKNTIFKGKDAPFIMELPPYRLPSFKTTMLHVWDKARNFLIKAGTIIFSMSVVIWLLQNFNFRFQLVEDSSQSIFGSFGRMLAPLFAPLGFGNWQASMSLLTGLIAKEAVVSTMMVLYSSADQLVLQETLRQGFTPLSAFCFMTFCLLYMPCISAFVSIKREMNSWKWASGMALFQTLTAYLVTFCVYQIGSAVLLLIS